MTYPFGGLVSFGGVSFLPANSSPVKTGTFSWTEAFAPIAGSVYPLDKRGISAAPHKDPKWSWEYSLFPSSTTLVNQAAYADLESQYTTLMSAFEGSYSDGAGNTLSGQVGWLTVQQADGVSTKKCWARLIDAPLTLKSGENTYYVTVTLTFMLLSPWQ